MHYDGLSKEEKKKILSIIKDEYVNLDFSKLTSVLGTNYDEPRWMDAYVQIYKAKLPPDISAYDILLEKLSESMFLMCFEDNGKSYIVNANELLIRAYNRFLITGEAIKYSMKAKYIPHKNYVKEICKIQKFYECGIYLEHIHEDKFRINPINVEFNNVQEARNAYDSLLDLNDFYMNVNMDKSEIFANYEDVLKLSKDKRMLATISNITNYFSCKFHISCGNIAYADTDVAMNDEKTATEFQARIIDAYHFYRNVVNTANKKDIISEIYNKKVDPAIKADFEENAPSYIKVIKNKDLIDWIVTISKESGYSLNITYDEQGVFYIDGAVIVTALDAKEYYIDYMDKKKEKLAVAIYKNNLITHVKKIWNKLRARFAKT